jgi:hypothetical protein
VRAGHASAKDYRLPLRAPGQAERELIPMDEEEQEIAV